MKARVSHLHKTEAEWLKHTTFVPEAGELIIYDADNTFKYQRMKIGDGKTLLRELPFFVDAATIALIQKQHYFEMIDAGRVTDY
jgi:hypothetical protein